MIKLYQTNAIKILDFLKDSARNEWDMIEQKFARDEISIFESIMNVEDFNKLVFNYSPIKRRLCVFAKGDYLFIGPLMKSLSDCCPFCILLYLAIDESSLKSLSHKNKFKKSAYFGELNIENTSLESNIICIDMKRGKCLKLRKPFRHPTCKHSYNNHIYNVTTKNSVALPILLRRLFDRKTGVIREMKNLRDVCSSRLRKKMEKNEVMFSWFQNPAFPLYPQIDFLDLATGSGTSVRDALRKAVFETIERYCVLSPPQAKPAKIGKFEDIKYNTMDPRKFWKYSEKQTSAMSFPFRNVRSRQNLKYIYGFTAFGDKILVPEDFVFINFDIPSKIHENTTSGCAAHISMERACINALTELVERDNTLRHWISAKTMMHIKLNSMPSELKKKINYLNNLGFDVSIINCSKFDSIFTFEAFIENRKGESPYAFVTSGAALKAHEGIEKSLREAIGTLLTSYGIEEKYGFKKIMADKIVTPEDHVIFYQEPQNAKLLEHYRNYNECISFNELKCESIMEKNSYLTFRKVCAKLKEQGVETAFVDMTLDFFTNFGVKVVRCISPQLMPLTFGTGMLKLDERWINKKSTIFAQKWPHPFS